MADLRSLRRFLSADDWETFARPDFATDQRRGLPPPPVEKPYPQNARLVDLIWPERFTVGRPPLADLITARESRRNFAPDPLGFEELSFLLWATQGVRRTVHQDGRAVRTFRTVPSGGGRHPIETYLAVGRVDDLACGLYRYLPVEHQLLPLSSPPDLPRRLARACLEQAFIGEAAVVFAWTAVAHRAEWRYSIVAHKMIAIDAGHICQNLYLAAEAIGAATCAVAAYNQRAVDDVIGVDGEEEFTIYLAPVGKRA